MFRAAQPFYPGGRRDMANLTPAAYRCLEPVLSDWVERVREQQALELPQRDAARKVAASRMARAVAGATGLLLSVVAFASAIAGFALEPGSWPHGSESGLLTALLLSAWPAALVAWGITRTMAGAAIGRRVHAPPALTGDAGEDLLRLQREDSLGMARALAARWEWAGAALPLAALSMVAPLSLHFLVRCLFAPMRVGNFDGWIALSVVLVGHAHVALCVCAVVWARGLSGRHTAALADGLRGSMFKALFVTVGVASLPGILLLAVPPVMVLVTGLVFIPAMYAATVRCMRRERLALDAI
jgi:hypothetical protein